MLASLFLGIERYSILELKRKQNFGESEEDNCLNIPQTNTKLTSERASARDYLLL